MMNRRDAMKAAGLAMVGALGGSNLLAANPSENFELDNQENCDTRNSKVWHSADMSNWKFVKISYNSRKEKTYFYHRTGIADVREDAFIWSGGEHSYCDIQDSGVINFLSGHVYGKIKMLQDKIVTNKKSGLVETCYINLVDEFTSETKFGKKLQEIVRGNKLLFKGEKIPVKSRGMSIFVYVPDSPEYEITDIGEYMENE